MSLTKGAITRSVFDGLDLTKAASAKVVKATFALPGNQIDEGRAFRGGEGRCGTISSGKGYTGIR
jgi:hypothetical protein